MAYLFSSQEKRRAVHYTVDGAPQEGKVLLDDGR